MSVDVDEAGRDETTIHVELAPTSLGNRADRHDPIAVDGNVRGCRRSPGAVDDGATAEHEVMSHASTVRAVGESSRPAR